ncbi:TIGR01777 family oxidoreductase [Shewanella acanthi]|uniref:TIGR01777 family oxidoreductase n=1 Tax=Shewanella acanthi TaxID=2864212 RepID=UPI001C661E72|nr:TIGR01777 family oxidoreductase [Shewanella acanthi]QYJ80056.1 TIGR01777 family oxidoreductase [Shewanella acanthi]
MKILITGASGFIGSRLVEALNENHELTLLTRQPGKTRQQLGGQHHYLASLDGLEDLNDIDAVINLAGEPIVAKRWSEQQKQRICESRWNITAKLSQLILASNRAPRVFISGSAIGYYGRQGQDHIDESASFHNEFSHEVCQKWEQLALDSALNTRVCIVRTGIVLGQGGALAKMLPPFKLGAGGPIGDGKQGMSWIHIKDMVRLIEYLLTHETCQGIFNATAPNPVSNAEFSKTLGKVLHRPAVLPAPAFALKLMLGEMAELLIEGQYVLPKRALDAGFNFEFTELETALYDVLGR